LTNAHASLAIRVIGTILTIINGHIASNAFLPDRQDIVDITGSTIVRIISGRSIAGKAVWKCNTAKEATLTIQIVVIRNTRETS
jgi:hypothetical protein